MKELFGQRLREQRLKQNLTLEQLAEKANLSPNYVGMVERGLKEPGLATIVKLLNGLNVSADTLLCDLVPSASHVTDDEISKRFRRSEAHAEKSSTRFAGHLYCQSALPYKRRLNL